MTTQYLSMRGTYSSNTLNDLHQNQHCCWCACRLSQPNARHQTRSRGTFYIRGARGNCTTAPPRNTAFDLRYTGNVVGAIWDETFGWCWYTVSRGSLLIFCRTLVGFSTLDTNDRSSFRSVAEVCARCRASLLSQVHGQVVIGGWRRR